MRERQSDENDKRGRYRAARSSDAPPANPALAPITRPYRARPVRLNATSVCRRDTSAARPPLHQRPRKRRARKPKSAIPSSALIKAIMNATGKVGTADGPIVIGLVAVLLPALESPPPDTAALLTSVPAALTAIFAVTEMSG